jgi:Helix-turn-helix domain
MREPPAPGYLLEELGYCDECEAAASLDITPKTLSEYRRLGTGPAYAELARKIIYSREAIAAWLAAGGTRGAREDAA